MFNLQDYKNKLLFIPLGGANEIGINVNLYHYEGKWIMIDCGSGFAEAHLPGVDMVVADLSFIEEYKDDLLGMILTHAHEDHLGGIQYLWGDLECPIYTTKFTKAFLKSKLADFGTPNQIQINEIDPKKNLNLGPFSIEFIGLTHSAPEMHALMIRTKEGNILHTGDWKFDPKPLIGNPSDEEALKKCGDEGVLALVCDSTNVFDSGISGSEGDVRDSLVKIIADCPKMIVVTTFASNLARLETIIYAGQKAGRKVALTGRSMHRMRNAALEAGYLNDVDGLIDEMSISKYKREELLIVATGCQGEPLAATSKMAAGNHHHVRLARGDTVIFSSKIIPGNDKKIGKLFNNFVKKGIEVITEKDHFVHVSGHPAIDELKKMYELSRPKIVIPVHGEPVHIHEHAKLARKEGVKKAIEVENGTVVCLDETNTAIVGRVKNGYLAIDGNYLLPDYSQIFKMRRRMSESGIVIATIIVDQNLKTLHAPVISVPGLLDPEDDIKVINELKSDLIEAIELFYKKSKGKIFEDDLIEITKKTLRRSIKQEMNKSPIIIINLTNTKSHM